MAKKFSIGTFLAGAAVGAGIALLFAPQEGAKTRKQLKEKFDELSEKAKNIDIKEVKQAIEDKIADIKADLKDLDGEKVLAIAKDKAKVIARKTDELVKYAVAKGTPVVQKVSSDIRLKTIDVLEDTITKLEAKEELAQTMKAKVPVKKTVKKVTTKK